MALTFPTFEAMHQYMQERRSISSTPSFLANLRGIKLEVYVSMDKGLWFWATQDILDLLGLNGSPGQRSVASIFTGRTWVQDYGLSVTPQGFVSKASILEHLERFLPFIDWLDLRDRQREVETLLFEEMIQSRIADNAPWFPCNLRGIRQDFSFLANGSVWCLASERLIERLALEIKPGRWVACRKADAQEWMEIYAIPGDKKRAALEFFLALGSEFPLESELAAMPVMDVVNAEGQIESIVDETPTHWKLQGTET